MMLLKIIKKHVKPMRTGNDSIFKSALILFRLNMSRDAITDSNSSTNTFTFLENCVLDADYKVLEEHLVSNPMQQSDLDRCLLRGLQIVQSKKKPLSHVAQALTTLLQFGAKWNCHTLLDVQKTPYHIICKSPGDHHELLDIMIKSSQRRIIDAKDIIMYTALTYAVYDKNFNRVKCLIANGADVKRDYINGYLWSLFVHWGNVELLKCLFNSGINIDSTDQDGLNVLWWAVYGGNIEAVRYLLDKEVAIPNYAPKEHETLCELCKENSLMIEYRVDKYWFPGVRILSSLGDDNQDPCMRAIRDNKLEIIKLLDERGS